MSALRSGGASFQEGQGRQTGAVGALIQQLSLAKRTARPRMRAKLSNSEQLQARLPPPSYLTSLKRNLLISFSVYPSDAVKQVLLQSNRELNDEPRCAEKFLEAGIH